MLCLCLRNGFWWRKDVPSWARDCASVHQHLAPRIPLLAKHWSPPHPFTSNSSSTDVEQIGSNRNSS
ncbi:hypothetical protein J6590_046436 [Homalodisca vitripennis]|nr:hypothetical protein J6590_046436 [Homalodisca vitripennis]